MTDFTAAIAEHNEAYGKLMSEVHHTSYSWERACSTLERLLESDGWRICGGGFDDVNKFLDSVRLDQLRSTMEQRKRIAALIKDKQPSATNRQIAKTVGIGHSTVDRIFAPSGAPDSKNVSENNDTKSTSAPDGAASAKPVPSAELSGAQAAKSAQRKATAKADRLARVHDDEERVLKLKPIPGKFRTIILDPAWEYDWLSLAGRAKPGYAMQTIEDLLTLDVRAWADESAGCHLYCWTTNNFMGEACKLIAHWGFQHRVLITWVKTGAFGLGSYFRNSTEHVLFATLGDTTTRPDAASIATHFEAARGEHSEKPEAFYDIVRRASYPPYGEGNQRRPRDGFTNLFEAVKEAAE